MPGIGHRGAVSEEPITDPEDVNQDNLPIRQDELEIFFQTGAEQVFRL